VTSTQARLRLFGAWCGPAYVFVLLVGWWPLARFFPPIAPWHNAEEVAHIFQGNINGIRIGMLLVMWAAFVWVFFAGAIGQFVSEIEGGVGMLTWVTVFGGVGNMVLTFYPCIWFLGAAFRPERGADLVFLANDMAWLQFVGGTAIFVPLPVAIAIAAFIDKSPNPVFPRWTGYFNILVAITFVPDQALFFFHSGPFAWNGLVGLWIPVAAFFSWLGITFWLMRAAVLRAKQTRAPTAEDRQPGVASRA
jgi:hypothetical protein